MSRVQLALNVTDLDAAVDFYTRLFGEKPAKLKSDYANFAISEPPLKLVLIAGDGAGGTLNHLGVEVETSEDVAKANQRLEEKNLETALEENTACCYARQDKVWVHDPDKAPWEIYTILGDAEHLDKAGNTACC